ncbi:MAG: glycoside hydrolase family 3 C-terminal domain-containing protein [Nannocystaceae bacterium]
MPRSAPVLAHPLLVAWAAWAAGCNAPEGSPAPAEPETVVAFDAAAIAAGNRGLLCDGADADARAEAIVAAMSLEEQAAQMHGASILPIDGIYYAGGLAERGVPTLKMVDGPRGVSSGTGNATAFPVGIARGATWDPALEKRVGEAIALEARAKGANVLLAPTINLLRHPGWGRSQETYSEDPFHMGALAVGFISGAQNHLIASAKHYAANSIEDTRFDVDVTIDERTLRELYLPHFRRAVDEAAVGSVMSAYNQVNGAYCSANHHLLTEVLRDDWGFRGFVESDWILGVYETIGPALAGLDVEMPAPVYFGPELVDAVEAGDVDAATVAAAARRILRTSLCFGLDDLDAEVAGAVVESDEHRALALEVAIAGSVLLKNDGAALPLVDEEGAALAEIAVVGALAEVANLGDHGSSEVTPSAAVTPLQGLMAGAERLGGAIRPIPRDALTDEDRAAIAAADAAVVVVGLTWADEGEAIPTKQGMGDRDDLRLSPSHEGLILEVAALNARTVVVLEGGGAIVARPWIDAVAAALLVWYPGMEGGHAIAEMLLGAASPGGKLPLTIPRDPSQLPPFDHEGLAVTYDGDHGYRRLDRAGDAPEFPFGHGLSYTTFTLDNLTIEPSAASIADDAPITVRVDVRNVGEVAASEVVQLYVGAPGEAAPRPVRELKAFGKVRLEPGAAARVEMTLRPADLAYYDVDAAAWAVEPGAYTIEAGSSSRDLPLNGALTLSAGPS